MKTNVQQNNPNIKNNPVLVKNKKRIRPSTIILHLILVSGAFIMIFPFLWTIGSSLKDMSQIFAVPPVWIPDPIVWSNYVDTLTAMPFGRAYWNSFYITTIVVVVQLFTASMAAYAFAKLRFRGSGILFILFLATMMIPKQVTMIPLYLIMDKINWLDTHLSLIVPGALFNAFAVFLLRQFIRGIPKELEEAALIDGANPLKIYWSIILPLIRPALAAVAIFMFMGTYNNFMDALIYLTTPEKFTVPLLLNNFKGLYVTNWSYMMAGATISVIPVLIVYVFVQRQIIEGVTLTGIKG